jgi:hypothetical protein
VLVCIPFLNLLMIVIAWSTGVAVEVLDKKTNLLCKIEILLQAPLDNYILHSGAVLPIVIEYITRESTV